jgi:NAD(P)-dependent dehydrogenase (short-subunit alcohol dehydrogenase family)
VNISSMGGIGFQPYNAPEYGAAKAGVVRLTASLVTLEERMGVRVNCICPGWVDTPASRRSRAEMKPEERERLVPSVLLRPEEIRVRAAPCGEKGRAASLECTGRNEA